MEESLELNRRLLDRSARVHEGYARQVGREPSQENRPDEMAMVRASSFVLAAVYRALIGDGHANELFREAAYEYRELDKPFHIALAVCANEQRLINNYVVREVRRDLTSGARAVDPEMLMYNLLAIMSAVGAQMLGENEPRELLLRLLDQGNELRLSPVGRLGLLLQFYISIGNAVLDDDRELRGLRAALADYLRRVDEVVGGAMRDMFHWKKLRSSVLPVEPEALAACMTVDSVSRRVTAQGVGPLMDDTNLTARQKVPAQVATEISRW